MANLVKAKVGLSIFSISILILIPLLESNFNAPVTIKRWGNLTWDDFKGFPIPFSGYGAVISSKVYLEFDSSKSQYVAFAGQHNINSWTKDTSAYGLNHEQYHFNITEIHARLLNEFIAANPNESETFYKSQYYTISADLRSMQKQYDDETDHSLIEDKQRQWEFRIDSMLSRHSKDSGWVNDYYSGAKIYFPATPTFSNGFSEGAPYRRLTLSRYYMAFSMISMQLETIDPAAIKNNVSKYYDVLGQQVKSLVLDSSQYRLKVSAVVFDTLKITRHMVTILDDKYLYNLSVSCPANAADSIVYSQIANSFIESFTIQNTDNYWINKLLESNPVINHSTVVPRKSNKEKNENLGCLVFSESGQHGFFRGPMFDSSGRLLIAYDIIEDADSLLEDTTLIFNQHLLDYKTESEDHIYYIPNEGLPKESFDIKFGYTLKQDSIHECYRMKYQRVRINLPRSPR